MDWLWYIALFVTLISGLYLNILGLPGLWLMLLAHALFAVATGWDVYVGLPSVITLFVLAVLAEFAEFAAGAAGSKVAGGSLRAMLGAIAGGIVGAILLTALVPIPVVGTIIGACLGAFIGAMVLEFWGTDWRQALRVGWGAAKGRFWGIVLKTVFGGSMLIVSMIVALPIGAATPPPANLPTPAPATTAAV